jgi:nucleoside-diphosphate-sugar epimerase
VVGCDAVVHLAAIPHPEGRQTWEGYFKVNVIGTNNVAAVAAESPKAKRLIYSSSTAYYGAHRGFPFKPGKGVAEHSQNGIQRYYGKSMPEMSPYNRAALAYVCSKIAAETTLAAYGMSQQLEIVILRFAPILAVRTPYEWGLLLYVENAAAAIVRALELPGERWYEIYNVQNEDAETLSIKRWANAILE